MLYQTDLFFKKTDLSGLYSDLAVKIHGYIMSQLPAEYAEEYHREGEHPFSIYCYYGDDYGIVRVSALNDRAVVIPQLLVKTPTIRVFGTKNNISIFQTSPISQIAYNMLSTVQQYRRCRLAFRSPAVYRSGGITRCDPFLPAYFISVLHKVQKFEGIILEKENVERAFADLRWDSYSLRTVPFVYAGRSLYGLIGYTDITLPSDEEEASLLRTLFAYASHSGIGGKTAQGCGGLTVQAYYD